VTDKQLTTMAERCSNVVSSL